MPAFQTNRRLVRSRSYARLWQEGYYEHVLRAEEDSRDIARYIIENPFRGGLVVDAREYPFVGSDVWSIDELLQSI